MWQLKSKLLRFDPIIDAMSWSDYPCLSAGEPHTAADNTHMEHFCPHRKSCWTIRSIPDAVYGFLFCCYCRLFNSLVWCSKFYYYNSTFSAGSRVNPVINHQTEEDKIISRLGACCLSECLAYRVVLRARSPPLHDSGYFCLEINMQPCTMEDGKIMKELMIWFWPP